MTDDTASPGGAGETPDEGEVFRLAFVPGATPGRWARTWRERLPDVPLELVPVEASDAVATLDDGRADAAILRLPVDTDAFSAIPLYEELPVVVVSRDHLVAATEDDEVVGPADIADDVVWLPLDDVLYADGGPVPGRAPAVAEDADLGAQRPVTTADAVAWVATGVGVTVVPMSLARLHHRKDVTYRVLDGGPGAPVALAWRKDRATDLVEELVGIVRGRTVNSSRGRGGRDRAPEAEPSGSPKAAKGRQPGGGRDARGAPRRGSRPGTGKGARRRRR